MEKVVNQYSGNYILATKKVVKRRAGLSESTMGYVFILPWIIGFICFTLGPMLFSLVLSFCRWDLFKDLKFIGFENYINIFTDDQYALSGLRKTLTFVVFEVPFQLVISMLVALLLNQKLKFVKTVRSLVYLPVVLSGAVAGQMWKFMYNQDLGIFNYFLSIFNVQVPWITDQKLALFSVGFTGLWAVGTSMILFIAALKLIPESYYEAAEIDGAGSVRKFFNITLPMLTPTILYNLITIMIAQFQCLAPFLVITGGGPAKSTYVYSLYEFQTAFKYQRMGYASALSWVMFIIVLVITLVVMKSSKSWVFYESERK
ncbi:hypothetical protein A8709_07190 [Paenibacillus pectinilyticus]|uniref:ABC transmembrane type-1 domain-containing protein n=1 Tax=Paenibacillus pectinilyticus TaxID=512399 RepID=A0A1C0ZTN6_9BACL|nr:sugar ABC transporter permease [Paenibacillus pectinilyticus]OCT11446.1 hypothetical protein A8709_07190 [Paenibacillus pectinilyticus]